jgi:hypothetical protein
VIQDREDATGKFFLKIKGQMKEDRNLVYSNFSKHDCTTINATYRAACLIPHPPHRVEGAKKSEI